MWKGLLTGSDICGMLGLLYQMHVDCSVYWLRCMWIVLFTGSDVCGLFCLLALIYVECLVYWL